MAKGKNPIHIKPSNRGKLHAMLGVSPDKKIPMSKLLAAKGHASGILKKRIVFAENARHWNHTNKG